MAALKTGQTCMNFSRTHRPLLLLILTVSLISCASQPATDLVKVHLSDDGQEAKLLKETGLAGGGGGLMARTVMGACFQYAQNVLSGSSGGNNQELLAPLSGVNMKRSKREAASMTYGDGIFGWHWQEHKSNRVALSMRDNKTLACIVQAARDYNAHVADYNATLRSETTATTTGGDQHRLGVLQHDASLKLATVDKAIARRKTAINNLPPAFRGGYSATLKPLLMERDVLTNLSSVDLIR